MAQLQKHAYRVTRMFGYQKPMQVGEEVLLTDFEAGRYSGFVEPSDSSRSNRTDQAEKETKKEVKPEVNDQDKAPNKKVSQTKGRRKSK
jgi:hypothetical protein